MSEKKPPKPIDCSGWDAVHLNASKNFLSEAEFLQKDGTHRELTLEIEKVTREEITSPNGSKSLEDLIAFKGKQKRLVANKTNKRRIQAQHGDKVRDWYGKKIVLFFNTSERYRDPNTGAMGNGCIRVRP